MLEYLIPAASTFAKDIDWLFDWITYLVGFWFFLTLGYFFFLCFRYRRRAGVKAQYITGETHSQKLAIEVPHYLILACDLVILVMTFIVWKAVKIDMPETQEDVRVISQQWAWTFKHAGADGILDTADDIIKINELHIQKGVAYRYILQSRDVMHSFSIPVFRLKQDAIPGRDIYGWFEANQTGEWDIQCAEMCGVAHGIMGARIFIKDEAEHKAWLAANTPDRSGALVAAGEGAAAKEDSI